MIIAQFLDRVSVQSQTDKLGQIRQLVHFHHVRDRISVQVENLEVGELEDLGVDGGERVEGDVEPSQRFGFNQQRVEGLRGADQRLDLVVADAERSRRKQRPLSFIGGVVLGGGRRRLK